MQQLCFGGVVSIDDDLSIYRWFSLCSACTRRLNQLAIGRSNFVGFQLHIPLDLYQSISTALMKSTVYAVLHRRKEGCETVKG